MSSAKEAPHPVEAAVSAALERFAPAKVWVAYSGGVDSHLLLHLLNQLKLHNPQLPPLAAIHINHQLQSQSGHWVQHCQQQCDALGVPLIVKTVTCDKGASLEQQAREARYQAFEQELKTGDLLLQGHHLDDQAETIMLRLLRGSGAAGLAAIPQQRTIAAAHLLRPLLAYSREIIESTAKNLGLQWIEDPSNQQICFDRNYLRQQLMPLLAERWPAYRENLSRSSQLLAESHQLNQQLAEIDADAQGVSLYDTSLPATVLKTLSPERARNLLRCWLSNRQVPMPTMVQLVQLLSDVAEAKQDSQPVLQWAGVEARRYAGRLYVMAAVPDFDSSQCLSWYGQPLDIDGSGGLSVTVMTGTGLKPMQGLSLRFRQGGERCRPVGRRHSQSLKKLMQEYAIAPWLRDRVPLVYQGDELVAVAGYWVCEGFQAAADETGWNIEWRG